MTYQNLSYYSCYVGLAQSDTLRPDTLRPTALPIQMHVPRGGGYQKEKQGPAHHTLRHIGAMQPHRDIHKHRLSRLVHLHGLLR